MIRPWIKVCGFTRPEDATVGVAAGVDLVGLNFVTDSPRRLELDQAIEISRAVRISARGRQDRRPIRTVAVLVNPSEAQVREILSELDPDLLQFHGEETPSFCQQFQMPFLKAFRLATPEDAEVIGDYLDPPATGYLIDAWARGAHGGTGQTLPLETARAGLTHPRGFLAGGLTPLNAYDLVRHLRPFGVDVASGVESEPGVKDETLMQRFVAAVEAACQP